MTEARELVGGRYEIVRPLGGGGMGEVLLARFHLAGAIAELGDRDGARAMFESFLRFWGEADRVVPEVAMTRTILQHL